MVYCIHCGQQNPDDAVTCSSCGKRLQTPTQTRPTRRSSEVCWEETDTTKGMTRGSFLGIGIVLICVALFISWVIYDTTGFEAFWVNFGESIGNFFENQDWDQLVKLIGPIMFVIGAIIIIYGLTRSRD